MNYWLGFRLFAVALFSKPEVGPSGFSYLCLYQRMELKELKGFFKSFNKKGN
jgi:hypothetical protein